MAMANTQLPEYLTVDEVAEILRVSRDSVLRALRQKRLRGVYLGTRSGWRVRRTDLDNWTTDPHDRNDS